MGGTRLTRFGSDLQGSDEEVLQSSSENEYPDPEALSAYRWWQDAAHAGNDNYRDGLGTSPTLSKISYEPDSARVELSKRHKNGAGPASTPNHEDNSDELSSELLRLSPDSGQIVSENAVATRHRRLRGGRKRAGSSRGHGETARRSLKGVKRGHRKPLEPSDEFKALHTQAVDAFVDSAFDTAEQLTLQAILVNPEMYAAHSLLSEIHTAKGDDDKALTALFNGAHTRPRHVGGWMALAEKLLERPHSEGDSALTDALYCYSRVMQVEPHNHQARHQRAELNRRLGYNGRAAAEYEALLRIYPHDLVILRSLAEIYTELDNPHRAMEHYNASIRFYQSQEPEQPKTFTWSDVNIYVELFANQQKYDEGLLALKSLSRWLLGRRCDTLWDAFDHDDREFDLDDHPRRILVQGFQPGSYDALTYGKGMPIELHVKLGLYRLKSVERRVDEALKHFELLGPEESSAGATLYDYPDLFRDVANALRDTSCYHEALSYYKPLELIPDYINASDYAGIAFCYKSLGLGSEAESYYRTIANLDPAASSARLPVPHIIRSAPAEGEVTRDVASGMMLTNQQTQNNEDVVPEASELGEFCNNQAPSAMLIPRPPKQHSKVRESEKRFKAQLHEEAMRTLYGRTQELLLQARGGDTYSLVPWMAATQELVNDFRSHRGFYPCERSLRAYEQSKSSAMESLKSRVNQAIQDIIGQLGTPADDLETDPALTLGDFRGIPLASWLDLMLEYAVLLARSHDTMKAYQVLNDAKGANIFYSSVDSMFLIHVSCALIANDEETSCTVARWFMKEFQFVSDGYRLFSAVNRLCDGKSTWFNSGPSQKYIRRQLRAMDYSLLGQSHLRNVNQERASYTTRDSEGNPIHANDMDIALLMLYGHMLYLGKSFAVAINYFFRAFALDSKNPVINLSLALAYVQYALKCQSDNRHHLIAQGLTFLFAYYDLRRSSGNTSEKQEAEFNVARTYHMLGLTHLAVPYYEQCLSYDCESQEDQIRQRDDFAAKAAFALSNIWAVNEEMEKASAVGRKYLII
ncbi:MAG: hypothetical protein Q9184_007665 [Pyrenodesmia sp. 2 TL-2023]